MYQNLTQCTEHSRTTFKLSGTLATFNGSSSAATIEGVAFDQNKVF